jgi:hypothetical protein
MQETVTLTKDELQSIIAQAVSQANKSGGQTQPIGPELTNGNLTRIREEAFKPGRQAVVLASGNGYRVYGYAEYQAMVERTSKLGAALRDNGRGIFAPKTEVK